MSVTATIATTEHADHDVPGQQELHSEEASEIKPGRYVLYNYGRGSDGNLKLKDSVPFNSTSVEYTRTSNFLHNLYEKTRPDDTPWIRSSEAAVDYRELMLQRIGAERLTKAKEEPASPVDAFLKAQGTDALTKALYPDNVQALLRQNEKKVSGNDWSGRIPLGNEVKPSPGVQVAFARTDAMNDFNYYQGHPIGPMSIEAAFMIAAQLTGVDWKIVTKPWTDSSENLRHSYWFGGSLQNPSPGDIFETFEDNSPPRLVGRAANRNFEASGNPDGGFYFVLDLDPDLTTNTKNVFIFAVHTVDPHSRVTSRTNTDNMKLLYSDGYNPTATPTVRPLNGQKRTVFFSHGHSAIMRWTDWMSFLGGSYRPPPGTKGPMPPYTQVGQAHFYILSENEKQDWPRYTDFRRGAGVTNMAGKTGTSVVSSVDVVGEGGNVECSGGDSAEESPQE